MKKAAMLLVLFAAVAAMAQTPKQSVAVYMAGTEPAAVRGAQKVLGAELAKALAKSGKYTAVDRTDEVIKVLSAAEIFGKDGAIDIDKAKRVGKQLGAQVVCVAEISEVMQSYFLEARLVNVETAEVSNVGSMYGNMTGAEDVARISQAVAMELVGGKRKLVDYTYREIKANPDKAIKDYTEAIRQEPDVVEYYHNRGYAYSVKEEYDIAIMDLNNAIRLDPNVAWSYLFRGCLYADKKDYDRAIADFNQAIRLDPNDEVAYLIRGRMYDKVKKDYDKAIADYSEAIRLDPDYADAYNYRGNAYRDKKDYDRAIADYNQAIRLNPNDEGAYNNRGIAYAEKGDYDRAIADYNQAIRLNPNNTDTYFNRGVTYYDKKDYNRAIADWESVLKINPNHAYARNNLEAVKKQLNSNSSGSPNDADAYYNRGGAYAMKGDDDRAIEDFNQAIRLNPNYAKAYSGRGLLYVKKKDYDRAIADCESALRIDPNDAGARKVLELARRAKQLNSNSSGVSSDAEAVRKGGASIVIGTLPAEAEVYIGGVFIGTSNKGKLQVPVGTYQVRFVKGGVEKTETMTFKSGENPTKFVPLR